MLTEQQRDQLAGYGECHIHHHPRHIVDADDVSNYQAARKLLTVTSNYNALSTDEVILVDTTGGDVTITLPPSDFKKEYQITKIAGGGTVYIVPTSPDTILGSTTGISFSSVGTSANLKRMSSSGYWLI